MSGDSHHRSTDFVMASHIGRARVLAGAGERAAAMRLLAEKTSAESFFLRASLELDVENVDGAADYEREALGALANEPPASHGGRHPVAVQADVVALRMALGRYDFDGAKACYTSIVRSLRARCADLRDATLAVDAGYRLASSLADAGRLAEGVAVLQPTEDVERRTGSPANPAAARGRLVRAQFALQDPASQLFGFREAQRALRHAIETHVSFVASEAALELANHELSRADHRATIAAADMAIALAPDRADPSARFARCVRAQAHYMLGDYVASEADLASARRANARSGPNAGNVTLTLIGILLKRTQFARARRLVDRCASELAPLGQHPLLGTLKIAHAIALAGVGERQEARMVIGEAVELLEHRPDLTALQTAYRYAHAYTGDRRFTSPPRIAYGLARGVPAPPLTRRQAEVAQLVAAGHTNRDVARCLAISEKTVGHHVESIFERLNIRARWQLADALEMR